MDNMITMASNLKGRLIMIEPLKKNSAQKKQQITLPRACIMHQGGGLDFSWSIFCL